MDRLEPCRAAAFFVSVAISATTACHNARPDLQPAPLDGAELPIRLYAGTHSHETRPMRVVVRDAETLARVPLQDITVDFREEMLLLITLGQVPSDRYAVSIDRVWREGNKLRVETTVQQPEPGAPLVMATPYCIAVVPRCDLNVAGFSAELPERARSWEQSPPPSGW